MLEGDDQWGPAAHLGPEDKNTLCSPGQPCSAVDSLGGSQSEDVDQHDLPPEAQSGADNVSDNVGQRLHDLAVLGNIVTPALITVPVDQPGLGGRG